jgi:hypothetical protein
MEAASMLDDTSMLLEESSRRKNGRGHGACAATADGPQKKKNSMTITEMKWKKITWDDISCTEEEVNVINKDEKTRLKTILGISPKKLTAMNLRTVCSVMGVDGCLGRANIKRVN